ncbi:MAG: hypothetical protein CXT67_00500 [Methanobacteriota archaeon]|nr:MAG: hypothetical protein CXT67_00500 [Euryarchaeota archaeon]
MNMADTLTLGGTATATLVGAWELRAGSHDTTEWLDGAADTSYPGGGPGTFSAVNSDGANGYDPAPKMALINVTGGADGETIILSGGASAILSVMATDGGTAAVAVGASFTALTATLQYLSGSSNVTTVMILYN